MEIGPSYRALNKQIDYHDMLKKLQGILLQEFSVCSSTDNDL